MEYVYAAMLIHKAGGKVDEASVTKVLEAAHVKVDSTRVKALVAALQGVNIDEAIEKASFVAAPAAAPVAAGGHAEAKKEEKKDDKKSEESAAAGLGALFG
ncbi:50S ribosomal protein P1 [archaeon]|nr:50S ribosomal protein P1 [archaeon]